MADGMGKKGIRTGRGTAGQGEGGDRGGAYFTGLSGLSN